MLENTWVEQRVEHLGKEDNRTKVKKKRLRLRYICYGQLILITIIGSFLFIQLVHKDCRIEKSTTVAVVSMQESNVSRQDTEVDTSTIQKIWQSNETKNQSEEAVTRSKIYEAWSQANSANRDDIQISNQQTSESKAIGSDKRVSAEPASDGKSKETNTKKSGQSTIYDPCEVWTGNQTYGVTWTSCPETNGTNRVNEKNPNWNLILANPWNAVPENFSVELYEIEYYCTVDKRIFNDLKEMMADAYAEGLSPVICSSFRSIAKQQELFDREYTDYLQRGYSKEQAREETAKQISIPGNSEHQTGLAVDIVAGYHQLLDEEQEFTAEQQWLMKNSYKYGFVLRYPTNKSDITGIVYEPWHYRYVGKEVAKEMFDNDLCLEEYLEQQEQ